MLPLSPVCGKYLKAFLTDPLVRFERTHVLADLLALCISVDNDFGKLVDDLSSLKGCAVARRYPGAIVSVELTEEAFKIATRIRKFVRNKLRIKWN
jgi:HEPN domain-containing protein